MRRSIIALALLLAGSGCKGDAAKSDEAPAGKQAATSGSAGAAESAKGSADESPPTTASEPSPLDRLLTYLPTDAQRAAYDRLSKPFKVDVLAVVFAIPPQAASLLDQQQLLDEGLDITLDGEAEPSNWLADTTLGFLLPMGKSPYFLRPLSKPASELGPLLEQGFTKTTIEDIEVWLPTGSFPWRIALLDGEVAAFVPVDAIGTGIEPLLAAREAESSPLETELRRALTTDRGIELLLFAVGPLVHYDISDPIAQVDFLLRRSDDGYQGQVSLRPNGSVDEALEQLRARKHPEENLQVQGLIGALELVSEQNLVVGQLAISSDRLKHFLDS